MAKALNEMDISAVNTIINTATDQDKEKLFQQLDKFCEKESHKKIVMEKLEKRINDEETSSTRSLLLQALFKVGGSATAKILITRLNKDPSERLRYQSATLLATLKGKAHVDVDRHLKQATKDESPRVKATALRLLLEGDYDDNDTPDKKVYKDQLVELLRNGQAYERWSAFKALREEAGNQPLSKEIEQVLIHLIKQTLTDAGEWRDIRYQAAAALGDVNHVKTEAVSALSETVKRKPPKSILLTCISSLQQLKADEAKDAVLIALGHEDVEINLRSAEALKAISKNKKEALDFIIHDLLQREDAPAGYLHGLRHIDNSMASEILTKELLNPDPNAANRAESALTQLGGVQAMRALQTQRENALDTYTELLGDADQKIMNQFDNLMAQARFAFRMSMGMHMTIFAIGVVILLASIALAIFAEPRDETAQFHRYLGVGGATGSLATLLMLFYKDPIRNISHSVTNLVKVNIVFLGYVRQINQIDATFKQLFLSMTSFGTSQMKETVEQIQISVNKTLSKVKAHLDEKDEENKETITEH